MRRSKDTDMETRMKRTGGELHRTLQTCMVWLAAGMPLLAEPLEDLKSADPMVRELAAEALRKAPVPVAESKWAPLVAQIHKGQKLEDVLAFFPKGISPREGVSSGSQTAMNYRLDSEWILRVSYGIANHEMFDWHLQREKEVVWVEPPAGYTGQWICYFSNGQPRWNFRYEKGSNIGGIEFFEDGKLAGMSFNSQDGEESESFYYRHDGGVLSRMIGERGSPFFTSLQYDESGRVVEILKTPKDGKMEDASMLKAAMATVDAQKELLKETEAGVKASEEKEAESSGNPGSKAEPSLEVARSRLTKVKAALEAALRALSMRENEQRPTPSVGGKQPPGSPGE